MYVCIYIHIYAHMNTYTNTHDRAPVDIGTRFKNKHTQYSTNTCTYVYEGVQETYMHICMYK